MRESDGLISVTALHSQCYDRASWTIIFLPSISLPLLPYCCTTDILLSSLDTVLSWTYSPIPRLGQDTLWTMHLLPYLLHALPSPLLYHLRAHQYLLMCTLCTPPTTLSPHCCLMYHRTVCAPYPAPLTCVTPRPLYVF